MQRIFLYSTFLMMVIMTATSCVKLKGEGPLVTEQFNTGDFSGVRVAINAETYYTVGSNHRVEIESNQNILDEIDTYVNGSNELEIRWRRSDIRLSGNITIRIRITAPRVRLLEIYGAGDIRGDMGITPTPLKLGIYGNGNIDLTGVSATHLDAYIQGSGRINITNGRADDVFARINGSGMVDFAGVVTPDAETHIQGSGTVRVHTQQTLRATINGSGSVRYLGNPVITTSITGSGSVSRL